MTKEIELADREQIEALRSAYGHELSAHAFLSMYLWQKPFGLSLYMEEELYTARMSRAGENAWFFPCGSSAAVIRFLERHHSEPDFKLCYLREQDVAFVREHFADAYEFVHDADASEYIYDRGGHEKVQGKLYANVRTQLHKIEREHELLTEPLTEKNLFACTGVLRQWEAQRTGGWSGETLQVDFEGLMNHERLGIDGILVRVDGEPAGVAAGYPLTDDTYDLFLAKAGRTLTGLNYYVQRAFFLSRPEGVRWINMEEDLGMEGLRNMKKRLAPVRMNELWRAERKR